MCAHWAWLVCGLWGHKLGLLCKCITGWIHSLFPHFCAVRGSSLFSHGPGDFSSPVFLLVFLWHFPNIWIWVVRKIHKKCLDIWIIILNRRLNLRKPLFFLAFRSLLWKSPFLECSTSPHFCRKNTWRWWSQVGSFFLLMGWLTSKWLASSCWWADRPPLLAGYFFSSDVSRAAYVFKTLISISLKYIRWHFSNRVFFFPVRCLFKSNLTGVLSLVSFVEISVWIWLTEFFREILLNVKLEDVALCQRSFEKRLGFQCGCCQTSVYESAKYEHINERRYGHVTCGT